MSVPSVATTQARFVATVVDEWVRCGVRDAVICPGSRSTPLALALMAREELRCVVRIDERSAAFYALGVALASGVPTIVLVTSGTAAAELHAAVIEADLANVPLLVVTADRPNELHGVGAPQTIRQRELFSTAVRRYEEPGVAREEVALSWRPLAARAFHAASGPRPGPVHLNVAFTDPLDDATTEVTEGRANGAPWIDTLSSQLKEVAVEVTGRRPMLVAGPGADPSLVNSANDLGWIVAGDATCVGATPFVDPLLRDHRVASELRPDIVVRAGGTPASKVLAQRLREWATPIVAIESTHSVADPDGMIARVITVPPGAPAAFDTKADSEFADAWQRAVEGARGVLTLLDGDHIQLSEPTLARSVVTASTSSATPLVIGSSMPVRDVEWFADPRRSATYANRGANGIDGVVSTVLGVSSRRGAIGLIGDVTFLHDVSALVDGTSSAAPCALVVADNRGGGIFNFLPQAGSVTASTFERLFGTPRNHDLVTVATAFGHRAVRVLTNQELRQQIRDSLNGTGLSVIVADVADRSDNVVLHDELNAMIAEAALERLS